MPKIRVLPDIPARWSGHPRATRWLVGLGIAAMLAGCGVWFGLELWARSWENRWICFVDQWEAKGESFGVVEHLPVAMGEEDEFVSHPWIRRIAEGEPEVLERVRAMSPDLVMGYEDWQSEPGPEGGLQSMPVELAQRLRQHGAEFGEEFAAFSEALQRPGSRFDGVAENGWYGAEMWVRDLVPISHLCEGLSHAAIALDDPSEFLRMIELQLRAGRVLRQSNWMLAIVVGCGFESRAYEALLSLPEPIRWPRAEQRRWHVALDSRTRTIADEYMMTMRVERGKILAMIGKIESTPRGGIWEMVPIFGQSREALFRVSLARSRLGCTEAMQEVLLSSDGRILESIDSERIARFQAHLAEQMVRGNRSKFDLGSASMGMFRGIYDGLRFSEEERLAVRRKLEGALED